MHFKWNYESPTSEQKKAAEELGAKLGISPVMAGILIRRNITTESAAKRFFRPQLNDLINPFLMKDMDVAVDRLNDAGDDHDGTGQRRNAAQLCGHIHADGGGHGFGQ